MKDKLKSNGYLFDSNIIIALLANDRTVNNLLNKAKAENKDIFFSMVSVCELYSGCQEKETEILDSLFTPERCIAITLEISKEAGILRKKYISENRRIKTPDALILATSKCHNLVLVTRDNDFRGVKECNVLMVVDLD